MQNMPCTLCTQATHAHISPPCLSLSLMHTHWQIHTSQHPRNDFAMPMSFLRSSVTAWRSHSAEDSWNMKSLTTVLHQHLADMQGEKAVFAVMAEHSSNSCNTRCSDRNWQTGASYFLASWKSRRWNTGGILGECMGRECVHTARVYSWHFLMCVDAEWKPRRGFSFLWCSKCHGV